MTRSSHMKRGKSRHGAFQAKGTAYANTTSVFLRQPSPEQRPKRNRL
jgi:hypothetical protein